MRGRTLLLHDPPRSRGRRRAVGPAPCHRRRACLYCLLVEPQMCPCLVARRSPGFGRGNGASDEFKRALEM
jgi:hypothetical protein